MKAEEAFKESERRETRLRLARNVRAVWGERTFLFRLSVLGFVFGVLVAFLIPVRYTSTTRLMPPDNQSGSSLAMAASMAASRGGSFAEIAGDLLGLKSTSDIFVGILNSRTVQDQLIQQFDLKKIYRVQRMEDARSILAGRTSVSVDRKNEIITVAVTDRLPERAAEMAKAYVDELNHLVAELSTSSARRERIFLEGRLAQVKQELETAEKEFSQFASKNSAINIEAQGQAIVEQSATLQGHLISAQAELEALRQTYSDSNIRVRSSKARVDKLQQELDKISGKDEANSLSADKQTSDLHPSLRKLPLLGVTYADLYRKTKVEESVYEALTQEYELARVQEAKEIPSVKVLDAANVPENKAFPPRRLICISGMLLAFFGGVVFLIVSRTWNEKDPDDLSKAIVTEIWFDLKENGLFNPVNGVSREPGIARTGSRSWTQSMRFLLGLNSSAHNGNGISSVSGHVPEEHLARKTGTT
jgi:uncharacterized protein involved in exopolysaccharide biosynthesis